MDPAKLKEYLERRGLANLYLAEKELGFCRQSLAKYLSGKRPIPKKLENICKNQNLTQTK
jgi:hypothetical protein